VIDQGEQWIPLQPTTVGCRGNQILANFNVPAPPLVFDMPYDVTTPVTFPIFGFRVKTSSGDLVITSVQIVGAASVLITVVGNVNTASNPQLQYAGKATYNGLGCLRDSDKTVADAVSSLTGLPYPLNNWCLAFQLPIVSI
jgi:hypothetical protein